ncbi:hypothetical protein MMC31_004480 [Peltigera leucophlebia]|nr:hypothetical protein [Peltigera leucophlebia]
MGTDAQWEVTSFTVQTSTTNGTSDVLYANGRMQVPVTVFIKAVKKGKTKRYYLSQQQLAGIELIDYGNSASTLSGAWTYSIQANEFANTLSAATSTASTTLTTLTTGAALHVRASTGLRPSKRTNANDSDDSDDSDDDDDEDSQSQVYWVSTTKVENKNVGARIMQPDGKTVNTHSKNFDSHVTLVGQEPITYTTDNITMTREDTANGTYRFDWQSAGDSNWYTAYKNWDQDNYYISTNKHTLLKADIYVYDPDGHCNGHDDDSRLANSYAFWAPDGKNLKLFFIWNYGKEAIKTAGLYKEATIVDWGIHCGRKAYAYTDIKVNQKKNALCLTRLAYDCPDTIWGQQWYYNCGFKLYDLYGNMGTFSASTSPDRNLVVISNANP